VLSQNVETTLNGVNPRHNILREQIAQNPRLVDDTHDPIPNAPVVTHIIDAQICDGIQEF